MLKHADAGSQSLRKAARCFFLLLFALCAAYPANARPRAEDGPRSSSHLLQTSWGQRNRYAKYSPGRNRLGCWSTALAQILYFHRLAPTGSVNYGCSRKGYLIKEEFTADLFDWNLFVDRVDTKTPAAGANEVAKYIYATAIAIQKDFGTGTYVLKAHQKRADAIARHYECQTELHSSRKLSSTEMVDIVVREIDARRPLMMHIRALSKDQSDKDYHALVVDGYQVREGRLWVHLNIGHKGVEDGWFDFEKPILKYNDVGYKKLLTVKPKDQD